LGKKNPKDLGVGSNQLESCMSPLRGRRKGGRKTLTIGSHQPLTGGAGPDCQSEERRRGESACDLGPRPSCWAGPREKNRGVRRGPSAKSSGGRVFVFSFVFFFNSKAIPKPF